MEAGWGKFASQPPASLRPLPALAGLRLAPDRQRAEGQVHVGAEEEAAAAGILRPAADLRERLQPLHQAVMIPAKLRVQVIERQHDPQRDTGAIRVKESAGVEMERLAVQRRVAKQDLVSRPLLRPETKDPLDRRR